MKHTGLGNCARGLGILAFALSGCAITVDTQKLAQGILGEISEYSVSRLSSQTLPGSPSNYSFGFSGKNLVANNGSVSTTINLDSTAFLVFDQHMYVLPHASSRYQGGIREGACGTLNGSSAWLEAYNGYLDDSAYTAPSGNASAYVMSNYHFRLSSGSAFIFNSSSPGSPVAVDNQLPAALSLLNRTYSSSSRDSEDRLHTLVLQDVLANPANHLGMIEAAEYLADTEIDIQVYGDLDYSLLPLVAAGSSRSLISDEEISGPPPMALGDDCRFLPLDQLDMGADLLNNLTDRLALEGTSEDFLSYLMSGQSLDRRLADTLNLTTRDTERWVVESVREFSSTDIANSPETVFPGETSVLVTSVGGSSCPLALAGTVPEANGSISYTCPAELLQLVNSGVSSFPDHFGGNYSGDELSITRIDFREELSGFSYSAYMVGVLRNQDLPPIIYLAGGPGGSPDLLTLTATAANFNRTLYGWNYLGTGLSGDRSRCLPEELDDPIQPYDCFFLRPDDIVFMNSRSQAHRLAAYIDYLRGRDQSSPQFHVYASSYGTSMGMELAILYPEKLASVTLDGVVTRGDPFVSGTLPIIHRRLIAANQTYRDSSDAIRMGSSSPELFTEENFIDSLNRTDGLLDNFPSTGVRNSITGDSLRFALAASVSEYCSPNAAKRDGIDQLNEQVRNNHINISQMGLHYPNLLLISFVLSVCTEMARDPGFSIILEDVMPGVSLDPHPFEAFRGSVLFHSTRDDIQTPFEMTELMLGLNLDQIPTEANYTRRLVGGVGQQRRVEHRVFERGGHSSLAPQAVFGGGTPDRAYVTSLINDRWVPYREWLVDRESVSGS